MVIGHILVSILNLEVYRNYIILFIWSKIQGDHRRDFSLIAPKCPGPQQRRLEQLRPGIIRGPLHLSF